MSKYEFAIFVKNELVNFIFHLLFFRVKLEAICEWRVTVAIVKFFAKHDLLVKT